MKTKQPEGIVGWEKELEKDCREAGFSHWTTITIMNRVRNIVFENEKNLLKSLYETFSVSGAENSVLTHITTLLNQINKLKKK
jgi:hypothetical protein